MSIKKVLLKWSISDLIKNLLAAVLKMRVCQTSNYQKNDTNQLIENSLTEKYNHILIDNIWGADLADMQLLSKFNKGVHFLLCVIDVYSKYTWVIPLIDKKGITITNAFQKNFKKI